MNSFGDGQIVFSEGQVSDFVGYIFSGEAEVVKNHGDTSVTIGRLKAGEYFGEMAALEGRNHGASVRAIGPLTVELIDKNAFLERVSQDSTLAFALLQRLSLRLHALDDAYAEVLSDSTRSVPPSETIDTSVSVRLLAGSDVISPYLPLEGMLVEQFPFRVGRVASSDEQTPLTRADLCLNDSAPYRLSRLHFSIEIREGSLVVRDLNSHLGTKVNETYIGRYAPWDTAALSEGENLVIAGGDESPYVLKVIV